MTSNSFQYKRVHYVHGKDSGPVGYKSSLLEQNARSVGWDFVALDYSFTQDPKSRADFLVEHLRQSTDSAVVLVGSSLGGWVAAAAANQHPVQGLFLLCPAFDIPGYPLDRPPCSLAGKQMVLVHGWQDSIVPTATSIKAAVDWQAELHLLQDDHGLHESAPAIGLMLEHFLTSLAL